MLCVITMELYAVVVKNQFNYFLHICIWTFVTCNLLLHSGPRIANFCATVTRMSRWYFRTYYDTEFLQNIRKRHLNRAKVILNIKFEPDYYFDAAFDTTAEWNYIRLRNITRDCFITLKFIQLDLDAGRSLSVDQCFLVHRAIILICSILLTDKAYFWRLYKSDYFLMTTVMRWMDLDNDVLAAAPPILE